MNESKLGFSQFRVQLQIRELIPKRDRYSPRICIWIATRNLYKRQSLACLQQQGTTQEEPPGLLACLRAGGHGSLFGQNEAGKGAGTELNNFVSPYPNLTNQNTTELFRELREVRHVTFG
jgi:hypothetical protein